MKKSLVLAMALCLICSAFAFAEGEDVDQIVNDYQTGRRLMTTTYSADYSVTSGITTTITPVTNVPMYSARIYVRDNVTKKSVVGWTEAQVDSTPDLAGVVDGVAYWSSVPATTINGAYTAMITEAWKVGKACAAGGKLVSVNSINTFDTKTGVVTINLLTGTLPTATWTP